MIGKLNLDEHLVSLPFSVVPFLIIFYCYLEDQIYANMSNGNFGRAKLHIIVYP